MKKLNFKTLKNGFTLYPSSKRQVQALKGRSEEDEFASKSQDLRAKDKDKDSQIQVVDQEEDNTMRAPVVNIFDFKTEKRA